MPLDDQQLVAALADAIDAGALALAYQPKIRLDTGALKRVEALVRWTHPVMGPIPPARFVPLAEQHGLIERLTEWGLGEALSQLRRWDEAGLVTALAFNLSALSLVRLDLPDLIERQCHAHAVGTHRLMLELTEGATQPLITLLDTLTRFRIKGIGLAIDDFGVGYSTLMQLRQLPFSELKIDRFFVADAPSSRDSALIVRSIIDLAHGLGLAVTAEGIETLDQLLQLRDLGCDAAQGFYISPPLAPDRMLDWARGFAARWAQITA